MTTHHNQPHRTQRVDHARGIALTVWFAPQRSKPWWVKSKGTEDCSKVVRSIHCCLLLLCSGIKLDGQKQNALATLPCSLSPAPWENGSCQVLFWGHALTCRRGTLRATASGELRPRTSQSPCSRHDRIHLSAIHLARAGTFLTSDTLDAVVPAVSSAPANQYTCPLTDTRRKTVCFPFNSGCQKTHNQRYDPTGKPA